MTNGWSLLATGAPHALFGDIVIDSELEAGTSLLADLGAGMDAVVAAIAQVALTAGAAAAALTIRATLLETGRATELVAGPAWAAD